MWSLIQHIYMLPLLISMLLSLKSFRQGWHAHYRIFAVLLLCVFLIESMAIWWSYYFASRKGRTFGPSNLWLYNLFLIPQYLLYMTLYYQIIRSALLKKILIGIGIVFTGFAGINMLYLQEIHGFNSYTLAMADGIVIFMTVSYFNQLLEQKEIVRLSSHPMVWISVGAFIFHAANLPYILALNYLIRTNIPLAIALFYIFLVLNCIMYSLYLIAFLCRPPIHRF
jgi:hypothetical protein